MNIQLLSPKFFNSTVKRSNHSDLNVNNASYPNLRPLERDTVSFNGKSDEHEPKFDKNRATNDGKIITDKTNVVTNALACKINKEAQAPALPFFKVLKQGLKNLVETDAHPDNPIMAGNNGIKCRVKSPFSIRQKAISKKLYTQDEIEKMGDLIGARIVMRNTTHKDFDKLFDALGHMVKNGDLKVIQLENYALSEKESYASQKTLEKFEATCNKAGLTLKPNKYGSTIGVIPIENGYTAIHLSVELPSGHIAEIQIMGRDMEYVKEVEDFYYKLVTSKKDLDPKYKPIQSVILAKLKTLDDFQTKTLNKYIYDSYVNARHVAPRRSRQKLNPEKEYLPFPYSLPQELSYINLLRMKESCDLKAKLDEQVKKAKRENKKF